MSRNLYIVDIDGCCADFTERNRAAGPEPSREDRAVYNAWLSRLQDEHRLANDAPVAGMADVVRAFGSNGRTYYVTGREEQYREVTEAWLRANGFPYRPVIMRQQNDWRSSVAYKLQVVSELQLPGEVPVILDDDPERGLGKVCREMGWTLLRAVCGGTCE